MGYINKGLGSDLTLKFTKRGATVALLAFFAWVPCLAQTRALTPALGYEVQKWPAGKVAPTLPTTDMNGKVWHLKDLRGKAVMLNFWASWCEPCRAEMPSLQTFAQTHADQLVVLTINVKEQHSRVSQFVQRTALELPVLLDPSGTSARAWGITIYPSTVLIDSRGTVRSVVRGEVDWSAQAALKLLQPLLKQPMAK
jgi:thiol-disulfide isomerase/thioredoxin